ncbi:LytR family transcriptional regulator [Nitriliruptoraceae bacterium ZYF776]|nr:LytR family transcriptional regulator [Profundirhabdus halotolerans]
MSRRARVLAATLVGALLLGTGAAAAVGRWVLPTPDGEVLAILLLGSDDGPPRGGDLERARADGFQLLFVAGDRRHASIISIPRDAYVPVPGMGSTRINSCLVHGPQRCVETAESVFGVEIDHYVLTNMRGFTRAVERIGGVEVDVPEALRVGGTSVAPGRARLDGAEALVYARDRKNRSGGDFGRAAAQAELLELLHAQVFEDPSPGNVLRTLRIVRRHTLTDLSGPELVRLGFEALHLPVGNVQRELAPGSLAMIGGASVVRLQDRAYQLVRDAADDGRIG